MKIENIRFLEVKDSPTPEDAEDGILYATCDDFGAWRGDFNCPCGCGDLISLSFLGTDSPRWSLSVDDHNLPTVRPSVQRTCGCKSHFNIEHGKVVWCT